MPTNINLRGTLETDPIRNFRYLVKFQPRQADLTAEFDATVGFTSVSGLAMSTESIPYRQGNYNAQPLSSKVLTTNGWKKMGDIQEGDLVVDPYGQPSKVCGVYPQGVRDVYTVTLRDGSTARACYQHLWEAKTKGMTSSRVMDTLELKERVDKGQLVYLPAIQPVEYEAIQPLPLDPYTMGVLLSEGSLTAGAAFAQDENGHEMIERVRAELPNEHFLTSHNGMHKVTVHQGGTQTNRTTTGRNLYVTALRDLGLFGKRAWEKFIPDVYKYASIEDRTALLRGIMDGDGAISEAGQITFTSSSEQFRNDVVEVINSLGGRATTWTQDEVFYTSPSQAEPKQARPAYKIGAVKIGINPFFITRKAERFVPRDDRAFRRVVSVEFDGQEEVQCIKVSADSHLYVTDNFVPTHNTSVHHVPGQTSFSPVTFQRGVMLGSDQNWRWMKHLYSVDGSGGLGGPGQDFRVKVVIDVLSHPNPGSRATQGGGGTGGSGTGFGDIVTGPDGAKASIAEGTAVQDDHVALKIGLANAWVTSLAYSDLSAGDNAVMVEQMTLVHEGMDVLWAKGWDSTLLDDSLGF